MILCQIQALECPPGVLVLVVIVVVVVMVLVVAAVRVLVTVLVVAVVMVMFVAAVTVVSRGDSSFGIDYSGGDGGSSCDICSGRNFCSCGGHRDSDRGGGVVIE